MPWIDQASEHRPYKGLMLHGKAEIDRILCTMLGSSFKLFLRKRLHDRELRDRKPCAK
jgi:hypothetical protein